MTREEIARGLRCSGSAGEKKCGGCPWRVREDVEGQDWWDCNVDQMALDAADLLENDRSQVLALQRELELKRAQLDCATASAEKLRRQNGELRDAAAQVTRLAGDAAEVVRCRDCRWFYVGMRGAWCRQPDGLLTPGPDAFCSFGERRAGEEPLG